jgi:hypothetical protein
MGVGSHRVCAAVRGVRRYPDPDQAQLPPTLVADCQLPIG